MKKTKVLREYRAAKKRLARPKATKKKVKKAKAKKAKKSASKTSRRRKTHTNGARSRAVLTIRNAAKMTPLQRLQIAAWLRQHAASVIKEGDNYAGGFQGRFLSVGR